MPSITSWTRLEPRARGPSMRQGLEAELADPLWLLARQWQFGEFKATDGGSPVQARLRADCSQITRWLPDPAASGAGGRALAPMAEPLETTVERERPRPPAETDLRLAAEAGLSFMRLLKRAKLAEKYGPAYLQEYEIPPPPAAQRKTAASDTLSLLEIVAGRAPHGGRLYADLAASLRPPGGGAKLPERPAIDPDDTAAVTRLGSSWLDRYEDLLAPREARGDAWQPERLAYEFTIAATTQDGELALTAPGYADGHLDWYSFDTRPNAALGAATDPPPTAVVRTVIPQPVRYRGMPRPRYWEFEDEESNFGAVEAAADDLGRLLLVEFALVYGNEFYLVPIDLEVGAVCHTRSLVITDCFGHRTLLNPARQVDGENGPWSLYTLSPERGSDAAAESAPEPFFLSPALGRSLEGDPIEEVLFTRDEMANIAWASEAVAEDAEGISVDRFEAWQERRQRAQQAAEPDSTGPQAGPLRYNLASEVPPHRYPLLPVARGHPAFDLRLGEAVTHPADSKPLGRILEPYDAQTLLHAETIPRTGVRVTRSYQYARWVDGTTHLWIGRRRYPGEREGSSGLRFDQAHPGPQEAS
jgi:hypothetical protein